MPVKKAENVKPGKNNDTFPKRTNPIVSESEESTPVNNGPNRIDIKNVGINRKLILKKGVSITKSRVKISCNAINIPAIAS